MLTAAKQQGLGDLDVGAIVAFQERISGLEDYPWPLDEEGRPVPGAPPREGAGPPPWARQGDGPPGAARAQGQAPKQPEGVNP